MSVPPYRFHPLPALYTEQLLPLLKSSEWAVLCYLAHRILGDPNQDGTCEGEVAVAEIMGGRRKPRGRQRPDFGTGLSRGTVDKAIESLCRFSIVRKVSPYSRASRRGPIWSLEVSRGRIDFDTLLAERGEQQAAEKRTRRKERGAKAVEPPAAGVGQSEGGVAVAVEA